MEAGNVRLPKNIYNDIIKECVNLFIKYDIRSIPIDSFEIANKMGIELKPYSRLTEAGKKAALEVSEDGFAYFKLEGSEPFMEKRWYVFYNDRKSSKRIKFTIMHEIGHIVREHTEGSDLAEAEANFFAKYSLAPPPLVHKISPDDYFDIAEAFDISIEYSSYAMDYYKKWLKFGEYDYTGIEIKLLNQFRKAI